jgi:hypothetical protein
MSKVIMLPLVALVAVVAVVVYLAVGSPPGSTVHDREHHQQQQAQQQQAQQQQHRGQCATRAKNVRDGRDPWGGCFPGPANTGVPRGAHLTDYHGPCVIRRNNTAVLNKTVNCQLTIEASGVVIRNSYVKGGVSIESPSVYGGGNRTYSASVFTSTLNAGSVNSATNHSARGICCSNFKLFRSETVAGYSGVFCEYYCVVRNSWIHGQIPDANGQAHESGLRLGSGTRPQSQVVVHNTIRCDADYAPPEGGCSADVTGYGDFDTIQNNFVNKNLLEWTVSGGYCAYGGSTGNKPYPKGNHNRWIDNVFQRGPSGKCGDYGAITDGDFGKRGNVWRDNHWNTGQRMPPDG